MEMSRPASSVVLLRGLAAVAVAAFVLALCGCEGGGHLLSRDEEVRLGQEAGDDFEREHGRDTNSRRNDMLAAIGKRVAKVAQPPEYPYDFRVLADDTVNAVAFPGGRIYVYRGLFETLKYDEDQIAWVVAHESAHVARRHATRRIEKQLGYELIVQLVFGRDTAGQVAGLVSALVLQDYGRDNEFEADRIGLDYAHAAGYDATASLAVLSKFSELQGKDPSDVELLFMTHPGNTDRSDAVKAHLSKNNWGGRHYSP